MKRLGIMVAIIIIATILAGYMYFSEENYNGAVLIWLMTAVVVLMRILYTPKEKMEANREKAKRDVSKENEPFYVIIIVLALAGGFLYYFVNGILGGIFLISAIGLFLLDEKNKKDKKEN